MRDVVERYIADFEYSSPLYLILKLRQVRPTPLGDLSPKIRLKDSLKDEMLCLAVVTSPCPRQGIAIRGSRKVSPLSLLWLLL